MQATERIPALEALRVNVIVGRAKTRLSQDELAQRAGISRHTVSRIERAANDVGVDVVQRIADALGVTVAELFAPPNVEPVGKVEIARRVAAAAEDRVNLDDLLDAVDEAVAADEPPGTANPVIERYSRAGRPAVAR